MRRPHGRPRPLQRAFHASVWGLAVATGLAACVDSGGGDPSILYPTLIAVAPQDFLGPVICADVPGGLRRYVVTLYDVTNDGEALALPSSGPVDCIFETKFRLVVPGNKYVARVEGYDRTDIRPLGSGNPVMVDATTGEYVAPRWTSACAGAPPGRPDSEPAPEADTPDAGIEDSPDGLPEGAADAEASDGGEEAAAQVACDPDPDPRARRDVAVTSVRYLTRRVAACTAFCDPSGPGVTGLSVRLERALGTLECGNAPGQVATFRIEREGGSGPIKDADCGEIVIFTESITPGQFTSFRISAFERGNASPSWETKCYRVPAAGTVLPVSCDPLVSTGAAPKNDL